MEWFVRLVSARPLITCLVIGVVISTVYWLKFLKMLNMKWYWAPILSVLAFVTGYWAGRLWPLLEVGFDIERAATLRMFGTILVLPVLTYFGAKLTKRDPGLVLDIMTVIVIIGVFFARANCIFAGCCKGVLINPEGTARWPLVEMELILDVILCAYFWNRTYKRKDDGLAYPRYLIIYGIFRFIIEWVREEYTGQIWIFHLAHIWALLSIAVSALIIYVVKKQRKAIKKGHSKRKNVKTKEVLK